VAATYWDWFKAVQTCDFATRVPPVVAEDEDELESEEDDDDVEPFGPDEVELLKGDVLTPPSADGGDAAMDLEPITGEDDGAEYSNEDGKEDGDDAGNGDGEGECVVDEHANDKVKQELERLQAWRVRIEARLHQLAIQEPSYWCRAERILRKFIGYDSRAEAHQGTDMITTVVSLVKKVPPTSISPEIVVVCAHTTFIGLGNSA
jgi:hypothetical protein